MSRFHSLASPRETFQLGPFTVPRLWTGLWQLSSNAWGSASAAKIRQGMARHAEMGYNAFGTPDHYGSAEILFGQFRESLPSPDSVIGATKWCVFRHTEPSRTIVEAAVRERMRRMRTTSVDLLQFHWQDYSDLGYINALQILQDLQAEGLIKTVGLCNFDAKRTEQICTTLGPGFIVSNQVQFSLIDTRPLHGMADVCEAHNVKLLTYGTLCGGFLADKWLNQPEPDLYTGNLTPSQRKYLDMILKAWGNWTLFQSLLAVLRDVGNRHGGLSIANIATRWVLDHSFVGAVIIGARLGVSEHADDNQLVYGFRLTEEDNRAIEAVQDCSNGRRMISTIGDCGEEYR
ncbi:NADP-dependent oxidoreductase domain-containing protein [Hygrophoropsis aurantiaca]|uniref:NADP-dependent oxidoreductase domain-containing protein n=1 Tax=Hygrophoropsis aurantiaca TaxID=72124 RepID=A0ACB8A8S5_9AGAM|nr:NADP-dependent oxidoreductase domain-containing protein [Hygrophoropsis aurantiaca]